MSDFSDICDATDICSAQLLDAEVQAARNKAELMPKGSPGDCIECGQPSQRLVLCRCAPCRDLLKLP